MKKLIVLLCFCLLLVGCGEEIDLENNIKVESDPLEVDVEAEEDPVDEVELSESCDDIIPFQFPPVNLEKVEHIDPLGDVIGNHVTPIDHQYYIGKEGFEGPITIEVYSPAAGNINNIQHMGEFALSGEGRDFYDDYHLVIDHGCGLQTIYIHIDQLNTVLIPNPPQPGDYNSFNIEVEAGDIIGWYGGSVDYNLVDENIELEYISPELYAGEPWKVHTPDPFPYFRDDIKQKLESLSLRRVEPYGGFIVYDVPETLAGNWFIENTNGYRGVNNDYWDTHIAIVYSNIDPDFIIVSLGDFNGEPQQFAVKGNSPDPAEVKVGEIVRYELTRKEFYRESTNERWMWGELADDIVLRGNDFVEGIVLFEVLPGEKLKVEIFPEGSQVNGFTGKEVLYER